MERNFPIADKIRSILLSCASAALAVAVTGCALPMNDDLGKQAYETWGKTLPAGNEPVATYVFHLKAVKDYEYQNYLLNLRRATSWGELGVDATKIVLDSLVAVTGTAAVKSALGAASAGVTGANTSLKKNVLFDQTLSALMTKMEAARLAKWNDILCKMGRGSTPACIAVPDYTYAEAFDDMQEYGHCGTLDVAIRDVAASAANDQATAKAINSRLSGGIRKIKPPSERF